MHNVCKGPHTIHQLQVHIVWRTKYRYSVLQGDVQLRCRDLLRQTCDSLDVQILKGIVHKDYIHLHVSYPPGLSIGKLLKRLKRKSAKMLLQEFKELRRKYWAGHLWGIGYGVWSTGNITDEMIQDYLNHHEDGPNSDQNFILE